MNTEIKLTGGARVGWINASWPFARLSITASKVILNATLLGKYAFRPEDIVSFEAVGTFTLLGKGIKINHNITDYPEKMIFWTAKDPDALISDIRNKGFNPKGLLSSAMRDRGFPIRWQAIVFFVVLWNALLLLDMFRDNAFHPKPGPLTLLATILVFVLSIAVRRSGSVEKAIMSPGHKSGEIRSLLYLLTFVAGFLSLVLGLNLIK